MKEITATKETEAEKTREAKRFQSKESRCVSQTGRRIRRAGQPSKQLRGRTRIWQTRRCGFANDATGPARARSRYFGDYREGGNCFRRMWRNKAETLKKLFFPRPPSATRLIFAGAIQEGFRTVYDLAGSGATLTACPLLPDVTAGGKKTRERGASEKANTV